MDNTINSEDTLSPAEKKRALYERQTELLRTQLSHGAISQAQYEKSFGDLREKMGYASDGEAAKGNTEAE